MWHRWNLLYAAIATTDDLWQTHWSQTYLLLRRSRKLFGIMSVRQHSLISEYLIPNQILDEVYNTLKVIRVTPHTGRHHIITEELYDLSTMAMEYFKEHLEPSLPAIVNFLDYNCKRMFLTIKYCWCTSFIHSSLFHSQSQNKVLIRYAIDIDTEKQWRRQQYCTFQFDAVAATK